MNPIWTHRAGKAVGAIIGVTTLTMLMLPPTTPRAAAPSPLAAFAASAPDPALIAPSGPQIAVLTPAALSGPLYTPDARSSTGMVTPSVRDLPLVKEAGETEDMVSMAEPADFDADVIPAERAEAAEPAPPIIVPPPVQEMATPWQGDSRYAEAGRENTSPDLLAIRH
ncbi:hypothetical protein [Flavisphingomonas formosensis]|uniref:hypothetical protein n=1 Tax=Flavisphingomonas formosensis TaxID=861534 RepID=UPI0012FC5BF5|nr:hypothetical protein [Sphingomonas formosensis]